jgi:hypothetical protein
LAPESWFLSEKEFSWLSQEQERLVASDSGSWSLEQKKNLGPMFE